MPTFRGPTQAFAFPTGDPLLDRLKLKRGVTVYTTDGGVTWQQSLYPYQGDLQNGDAASGAVNTLRDGVDYFLGGHDYAVSPAIAAMLTAAGFGAYLLPDTSTYSDTYQGSY